MNKNQLTNKLFFFGARAFRFSALAIFSFFALTQTTSAQVPAEFAAGTFAATGSGPLTAAQSGKVVLNPSGTIYTSPNTTVNITASFASQQYAGSGTGAGNPVIMFGATNTTGGTSATARPTYAAMNDIGSPANNQYSNTATGTATGIDVATNLAFNMYTSVHQWAGSASPATGSRTYMGDLTITFSTPLKNPLMHIVGLGGNAGATTGTTGFATELDLQTAGVTFTKLQGNTTLSVTSTQIKNSAATITASCSTGGAACGTIQVNGSGITSLTFKVYVRGDGKGSDWGDAANHSGDQWLMGFSMPETYTIAGNVFNDANGLGDGTVNGSGSPSFDGVQLYANLVNPSDGKVVGSTPLGANGAYSFNGIPSGANLSVEISTLAGNALSNSPARALPSGWSNTGENIGTGAGSDGAPNGMLSVSSIAADVSNVNFGITKLAPTAGNVSIGGRAATTTGRGVFGARVTLIDSNGVARFAATNPFGYYRFDGVAAGETVVLSVRDKRYTFDNAAQALFVTDERADINFVGRKSGRGEESKAETSGRAPFDFDGDGKTDIAVYRPSNQTWYILQSATGTLRVEQFAPDAGEKIAPADYDGDGATDLAVYNSESKVWTILKSSNGERQSVVIGSGESAGVPAAGDYDGDGKADIALAFQNDFLEIRESANNETIRRKIALTSRENARAENSGAVILRGDFDGDGRADDASFDGGTWRILRSSDLQPIEFNFGLDSDIPAPSAYLPEAGKALKK